MLSTWTSDNPNLSTGVVDVLNCLDAVFIVFFHTICQGHVSVGLSLLYVLYCSVNIRPYFCKLCITNK